MDDYRQSPEHILEEINRGTEKKMKGRLKIFFGYAAGVGKTYAMLKAAHVARHKGTDVVAGYIEPHARPKNGCAFNGAGKAVHTGYRVQWHYPSRIRYRGCSRQKAAADSRGRAGSYQWRGLPSQKEISGYQGASECRDRCLYHRQCAAY